MTKKTQNNIAENMELKYFFHEKVTNNIFMVKHDRT